MKAVKTFASATALAALLVSGVALADDNSSQSIDPKYKPLVDALHERLPNFKVDRVLPSPVPGLLEVLSGREAIYVDPDGKYAFNAHMYDLEKKADVTAESVSDLVKIDPAKLPLSDSFTIVHGTGERQLYVFSDPDCPFCRKLEHELPNVKDVTIHVFLYPLVQIHPHAHVDAVSIWCAKDRGAAWTATMINDKTPDESTCENPVDRNVALGEKLGIDATPTMIFPDGHVVAGTTPASRIEAMLAQKGQ